MIKYKLPLERERATAAERLHPLAGILSEVNDAFQVRADFAHILYGVLQLLYVGKNTVDQIQDCRQRREIRLCLFLKLHSFSFHQSGYHQYLAVSSFGWRKVVVFADRKNKRVACQSKDKLRCPRRRYGDFIDADADGNLSGYFETVLNARIKNKKQEN